MPAVHASWEAQLITNHVGGVLSTSANPVVVCFRKDQRSALTQTRTLPILGNSPWLVRLHTRCVVAIRASVQSHQAL